MTRQEARDYYKGLAQKAGVKDEQIASVLQVLEDDTLGKVFLDAFVPRPQYSSDLDARENAKKAAETEAQKLRDWYEKDGRPAYEQNLRGVAALKKYEETYGPLDESSNRRERQEAANQSGLTLEEVTKLLDKRLQEQGQAYVGLTKTAVRISQDYTRRFNEPLDVDELEQFALKRSLPLDLAYDAYIAPKVEKATTAAWEAKVAAARLEGEKAARSKSGLPADSGPREPHPIFDHVDLDKKGRADVNEDKASRDAFLEGWNEAAAGVTDQNR